MHEQTVRAATIQEVAAIMASEGLEVQSIEVGDVVRRYEPASSAPEPAPRVLPSGVTGRPGTPALLLGGALFAGVALVFMIGGIVQLLEGNGDGIGLALFPILHFAIGILLLWMALSVWFKRRRLYREGIPVVAVIDSIGKDASTKVNGRSPFEMHWTFYLGDDPWHGKRSSMNHALQDFGAGDRIWVLYDPDDPSDSVEWPPL